MLRSIGVRLAALYTGVFAVAVTGLGAAVLLTGRAEMERQFDKRINSEVAGLVEEYRSEGMTDVIEAVREREDAPGALDYGLRDPAGRPLIGRLAGLNAPIGWSIDTAPNRRGKPERVRFLTTALPSGYRILVGDDIDRIEALDGVVLRGFAIALLGVIVLGGLGGYALSRDVQRRFAAMSGVAEAIIDGDMARRVPVSGAGDDLDRLAASLNRMLDRIGLLMDSLRQVSNDVAHDLRTPLTRLRQRLEAALAAPTDERGPLIEAALGDLDAALDTFAALLRIAEVEGGDRRMAFRPLDLAAVAGVVVEAFAPSAEEGGRSLVLATDGPAPIEGDPELLPQLIVNLIENGLRHTPEGSRVRVSVLRVDGAAVLSVADDGPGVPAHERTRVFERFYRLETSRTAPGSGLGLALVAAIARLHGAEVGLFDAGPGLEARVRFPSPSG